MECFLLAFLDALRSRKGCDMLRLAAVVVTVTVLCTLGLQADSRATQGPVIQMPQSMELEECNCGGFFYGLSDISSPPSFGPIWDGGASSTNPGQCEGFCAGWAYVTAAGLCSYQAGTVAVAGNWDYSSPSGSGQDRVTYVQC